MADLKKSPSLKAQAKHNPQSPLPQSKRRKRSVSTFLQGDVTLTDKAYAQIEELIVTLQLPPGTVLSELVLADRLGIGRTPIREALQRLMARGAAERASEEQRAQFSGIAAGMYRASDTDDDISFMRLDQQFNTLVSLAARNEFASRSMGLMHGLSRRFWYQHYKQAADLPLCARLHAAVAEAIANRDPDKAAEASDRLIDYIESFARSTL